MVEAILEIPAEHIQLLRRAIKGELAADCDELPKVDPGPDDFEGLDLIAQHRAVLDGMGWSDDGASKQIEADPNYLKKMIDSALDSVSDEIACAAGEYRDDNPVDYASTRALGEGFLWLLDARAQVVAEVVMA